MSYDKEVFFDGSSMSDFIEESVCQYSRLAYNGKDGLIKEVEKNSNIEISSNNTYSEIVSELDNLSNDQFLAIFNKRDFYGLAESYQFYKFLSNDFNDGQNDNKFQKYYNISFEEDSIKHSEIRKHAKNLIVNLTTNELRSAWRDFASSTSYLSSKYISIYGHLTTGPLGPMFCEEYNPGINVKYFYKGSSWERNVSVLDRIFHPKSYETDFYSGNYPFDLENSDLPKVFSDIFDLVEDNYENIGGSNEYSKYIGSNSDMIESQFTAQRDDLLQNANQYKEDVEDSNVNELLSTLSQGVLLFVPQEELIRKLNDLIISGELQVSQRSTCGQLFKITEDGIVDISKDNAVFELADDVATIKGQNGVDTDINEEYIRIANSGVLNYLDNLADDNFDCYESLLHNNNLGYEEKHTMVADRTKVVLLENYGINIHLRTSFMTRDDLRDFLLDLGDFKENSVLHKAG